MYAPPLLPKMSKELSVRPSSERNKSSVIRLLPKMSKEVSIRPSGERDNTQTMKANAEFTAFLTIRNRREILSSSKTALEESPVCGTVSRTFSRTTSCA